MRHQGSLHEQYSLASSVERTVRTHFEKFVLDELIEVSSSGTPACDMLRFRLEYLSREIFSKYLDPSKASSAEDRKSRAIAKWKAMELRNAATNVRLFARSCEFRLRSGRVISSVKILDIARATIRRVIGDAPPKDVLLGTFTGGASTSRSRGPGVVAEKFMEGADATSSAHQHMVEVLDRCEALKKYRCDLRISARETSGSILFTVPKNSEIDRCAAKEPDLNMFLQKGVGHFFRHSLKRRLRIDLNDQSRNQELARVGSIDGSLATLDLSSASDLISDQIVRELIPFEWFEYLNDIRSRQITVEGEVHEMNMFSSMGNAFTFELESMIFYALVNAVCYLTGSKGTVSVYGDDIICPSSVAGLVARVFAWFGFKVNPKKSHWRGPFRESCGKHWYSGTDVTPFYVKEPIADQQRMIHYLNQFRQWSTRLGWVGEPGHAFHHWKGLAKFVDSAFYGGRDCQRIDALVSPHRPLKRLVRKTRRVRVDELGGYLHWLRASEGRGPSWTARSLRGQSGLLAAGLSFVNDTIITSESVVEVAGFKVWASDAKGTMDYPQFVAEWASAPISMTPRL